MRSSRGSLLLPVLLLLLLVVVVLIQRTRGVHLQLGRDGARAHGLRERAGAAQGSGHHPPPTYMVHLYRNFRANASASAERRADTVRSLTAKGLTYGLGRWAATFDLHALLPDKRIQAAELRLRLPPGAPEARVAVYHQHGPGCHPASDVCREEPQRVGLLGPSSLVSSFRSWRVFNVTGPLLAWQRQRSSHGVRRRGLTRKRKGGGGGGAPPAGSSAAVDRALLVVFSRTGSDRSPGAEAGLLHTAERSKFLSLAESGRPDGRRSKRGQEERPSGAGESACRRVDLHVDFQRIGWGSWIVFPKRYNAYRCQGSCPGPLSADLNPTNHAYVQSLLNHYHPDRAASPCCAPTRMSPLSMLYYENGEMLLRHHEDMMVDECGCL
ncbi:nodal-related 2 [Syngnathoides biaculeatus]|uniref:nodal-related 2 n=1 Tax=Syngnathoides biaculeatus TaxID=300417 RepID=UPI002ADDFCB5|nr:nodal-related 2 [Syngnathoides biaculeatus]